MATKKEILTNLNALPPTLPVNPDGIPQELKALPQWVCWCWQSRDGKWTKVPIDPVTGGHARSNDPDSWDTFDQALSYYQQHEQVEGVGFVFTKDDPYCGVDFDDTTETAPVLALSSYAEHSPTGTGFHCIVKARLAPGAKNRKGNLEVYDRGRYFAITGYGVDGAPETVEERQAAIEGLLPQSTTSDTAPASPAALALPEDSLTAPPAFTELEFGHCAVSTWSDEKFRLLEAGEWQKVQTSDGSQLYPSQSEADLAFCCLLAMRHDGDTEAIDRAFRASGLMRQKWDREDYREATITSAIDWWQESQAKRVRAEGPALAQGFRFDPIDSATFANASYRQEWLVNKLLVAQQPCIVGGPKKSLKTSIALELAISLGSGRPFLESFMVPNRVRVAVLSGESGERTLQETARRICKAKGIELPDVNCLWGFDLPQFARAPDMAELRRGLQQYGVQVLIIDPIYLCTLAGATQKMDASNLFHMGPLFLAVSQACLSTGCTPILLHHTLKGTGRDYTPLDLDQLAYAGIAEFARQWIILSRREAFVPGSGTHRLWMQVGGSAGHNGLWSVDVDEGQLQEDFSGRTWQVKVATAPTAIAWKEQAKADKKRQEDADDDAKVLNATTEGRLKSKIKELTSLSDARVNKAIERLVSAGRLRQVDVKYKGGKGAEPTGTGYQAVQADHADHADHAAEAA